MKPKPLQSSVFKFGATLLILLTLLTVFLSYYLDVKQVLWPNILPKMEPRTESLIPENNQTGPLSEDDFCRFRALSPEEELEERLMLESNAWPQTPSLSGEFSLLETSNPRGSSFTILPRVGGQQWQVGDRLQVTIDIRDFRGNPKKYGGDFLIARLHNPLLFAGVAGRVVDHLNGSYSAVFPLLWDGKAIVEVKLVHSSEAITVLRKVAREHPDRVKFGGVFRKGRVSETTVCNVCLRPIGRPICDFTDDRTGEPWFCYKPIKMGCDFRISHTKLRFRENFGVGEKQLFQIKTNLKVAVPASGPESVIVLPVKQGVKGPTLDNGISGYYYRGLWQSVTGTPTQHFENPTSISQCLQDKTIYLFGDSTIRQWYTYLLKLLPGLKQFNLHTGQMTGPFLAVDFKRVLNVKFHSHGPPINFANIPVAELQYVANELDAVAGGGKTIVVIGIWCHLGAFPLRVYSRRLQSIRQAVVRLLTRAPGTLVVIRTANFKTQSALVSWVGSDWYALERDKILRAVFKGVRVQWVDAWEMTLAHYLKHELHPQDTIIKNMIDVLLSYICPQKGRPGKRVKG